MKISDKIKIKWMHQCSWKTDWENKFLYDIEYKDTLTYKQSLKLDEIYQKWRKRKGNCIGYVYDNETPSDYRFCEKHGVSYDDVHDFDK